MFLVDTPGMTQVAWMKLCPLLLGGRLLVHRVSYTIAFQAHSHASFRPVAYLTILAKLATTLKAELSKPSSLCRASHWLPCAVYLFFFTNI
jgi:hypothetical protein